MKKTLLKFGLISASAFTPFVAFAALDGIRDLIESIGYLVKLAIPVMVGIALLAFFYGLVRFILNAGDLKGREEGRNIMIWGIIALFVMLSVWGLVSFIQDNLDIPTGESANFNL